MYPQDEKMYEFETVASQDPKTLEIIHNELSNITDRIIRASGRLSMMADRAYGSQPQAAGTVSETAKGKPPIVDQLGSGISYLNEVINQLESNIHRVERLV